MYQNMKYELIIIHDPKSNECEGVNKEKKSLRNEP